VKDGGVRNSGKGQPGDLQGREVLIATNTTALRD
jgi:hypothetical protein